MFPNLDPLFVDDDPLFELAQAMIEGPGLSGDNPNIPAGFTYLGQFVDHDLTLDTTPLSVQRNDPLATVNFRTPALDLDSLYLDGPDLHPFLYERDPATFKIVPRLLVGKTMVSPDAAGVAIPAIPNDLPRNQVGRALIGDERNDENLLVAQLHLAFIKFHNKVVDLLVQTRGLRGAALFEEARRIVTWHYQWIVLFDFVDRLTQAGFVRAILQQGRRFYRFRSRPYMPVEFAAAAYRLGHSMVRNVYSHNRVFRPGGLAPGTLDLLFRFTGKSGNIVGDLSPTPANPPDAMPTLPSNWAIDWRRFFDLGTPANTNQFEFNASRLIDPFLADTLHHLPGENGREMNLAFRNLQRGIQIGLPSGQDVAKAMGLAPLAPSTIANSVGQDGAVAQKHGMHVKTPLWYYVLKEAQVRHNGLRLGPVGSTIVAETLIGIVHGDHTSFLWQRSNWVPELPSATPGHFTMADMLRFVGDINPIN